MTSPTLLVRQRHPNFLEERIPSSQAFARIQSDEGKLSVHERNQVSPELSNNHYTDDLNLVSTGVWGITKKGR